MGFVVLLRLGEEEGPNPALGHCCGVEGELGWWGAELLPTGPPSAAPVGVLPEPAFSHGCAAEIHLTQQNKPC